LDGRGSSTPSASFSSSVLASMRGLDRTERPASRSAERLGVSIAAHSGCAMRFGDTYASLSAAGRSHGGCIHPALPRRLYDLIGRLRSDGRRCRDRHPGAVMARRWNSETLASLGLLGAILAPVAIAIQGDLTRSACVRRSRGRAATAVAVLKAAPGCRSGGRLRSAAGAGAHVRQPIEHRPSCLGIWLVLAADPGLAGSGRSHAPHYLPRRC